MSKDSGVQPLNANAMRRPVFGFMWRNHRKLFLLLVVVLAALIAAACIWHPGDGWAILQNFSAVITLVVAVFIWWTEQEEEWRRRLPKRLTVRYMFENREVMRCEEAYLAGEADIRAWSQQLGSQMADQPLLSFFPTLKQTGPIVCYDQSARCNYVLYDVMIILRRLPKNLQPFWDTNKSNLDPFVLWKTPRYADPRYENGIAPNAKPMTASADIIDLSRAGHE